MTPDISWFRHSYTCIYSSPDGVSHFAEATLAMEAVGYLEGIPQTHSATAEPPTALTFAHFAAGYLIDWHNPPTRRFILFLSGLAEVTAGDGDVRRFGPGSVLFVEDMAGKGHQVRGVEDFVVASVSV